VTSTQASSAVVLIAEDEALVRMIAAEALREVGGFEVLEAASADEALTVLQVCGVSVLVTDVEMPGTLNGFALARRVAEAWPQTGIVVVTGRAIPAAGDLPAGAHFVSKPYAVDTLIGAVQAALVRAGASIETGGDPFLSTRV
jgi:CheY-like chemotaxis protein